LASYLGYHIRLSKSFIVLPKEDIANPFFSQLFTNRGELAPMTPDVFRIVLGGAFY